MLHWETGRFACGKGTASFENQVVNQAVFTVPHASLVTRGVTKKSKTNYRRKERNPDDISLCDFPTEYQIIPSSKILQGYAGYSRQLADYLRTVVMAGKTWKLCFRASENNFLSESFHAHCDDQGPTVTLVRVGEYVFGGYTDRAWNSSE